MLRLALFALLTSSTLIGLAASAGAQVAPDRDVRLDGVSLVGRWTAVEVVGDGAATADLAEGTLSTVLVINPTGHVILRGADRRQGRGAPALFTGVLVEHVLRLNDLPGEAEVQVVGRRLHIVDPRGRRTVFVRAR
ncbi:hypothetical protein [Rubrivirga sp. IMCC43871]|uniref:hypothetical protein n=1 Tax=Rubrivirga sp. IMCC43871 TaxID=3391575 RepID=UPI00398FE0D7